MLYNLELTDEQLADLGCIISRWTIIEWVITQTVAKIYKLERDQAKDLILRLPLDHKAKLIKKHFSPKTPGRYWANELQQCIKDYVYARNVLAHGQCNMHGAIETIEGKSIEIADLPKHRQEAGHTLKVAGGTLFQVAGAEPAQLPKIDLSPEALTSERRKDVEAHLLTKGLQKRAIGP